MPTKVLVRADVNPTEDEAKVRAAVTNLIGTDRFSRANEGRRVVLTQEGDRGLLIHFRVLLRRERILDAARKMMHRGIQGTSITFYMNKQVAYAGHASFCRPIGESPMGPITFCITDDDPNSLIEWLATKTVDGIPVD
jgi:predicted RNA binding protein with dsRBD fold (UPF0201 family)